MQGPVIAEIISLLVVNGDIRRFSDADQALAVSDADAVMVGRAGSNVDRGFQPTGALSGDWFT